LHPSRHDGPLLKINVMQNPNKQNVSLWPDGVFSKGSASLSFTSQSGESFEQPDVLRGDLPQYQYGVGIGRVSGIWTIIGSSAALIFSSTSVRRFLYYDLALVPTALEANSSSDRTPHDYLSMREVFEARSGFTLYGRNRWHLHST
jgi:hypothetical protein